MASTSPVFVISRNLPDNMTIREYEICLAAEKSAGRGTIFGAQLIGSLWRIVPNSAAARATLLAKGLEMGGRTIPLKGVNPFEIRGSDGLEIPGTRLTVSDVPFSVSNRSIESALLKLGLKLRSPLKMEGVRDHDGKLTEWLNGRRFAWIDLPSTQINPELLVGKIKARLYFREMKAYQTCKKCLQKSHSAGQCCNQEVCLKCKREGHKAVNCPGYFYMSPQHEDIDETFMRKRNTEEQDIRVDSEQEEESEDQSQGWNLVTGRKSQGRDRKKWASQYNEDEQASLNVFEMLCPTDEDRPETDNEEEVNDNESVIPSTQVSVDLATTSSRDEEEVRKAAQEGFWGLLPSASQTGEQLEVLALEEEDGTQQQLTNNEICNEDSPRDSENRGEQDRIERQEGQSTREEVSHGRQDSVESSQIEGNDPTARAPEHESQGTRAETTDSARTGGQDPKASEKPAKPARSGKKQEDDPKMKAPQCKRDVAEDGEETTRRGRGRGKPARSDSPSVKPFLVGARERSGSKRREPDTPTQATQTPSKK